MTAKVFIPQDVVDSWVTADRVDLAGEILTFRGVGLTLRMVPAYFFGQVSGGSDEGHNLLGKAKLKAAIAAMGAEAYMNSVILAETAYEAEPGFIAKPLDAACTRADLVAAMAQAGT